MLGLLLLFLILLWLTGYIRFPLITFPLINFRSRIFSLNDILLLIVFIWLISILPGPFRQIAVILLIIWLLSVFGVIAIAGFSQLVLIAAIIGIIIYLTGFVHK